MLSQNLSVALAKKYVEIGPCSNALRERCDVFSGNSHFVPYGAFRLTRGIAVHHYSY